MEVFILLTAGFLAITNAFAGALHGQDVPLVAPFALADESAPQVFILVGERAARLHFDDQNLLVEVMI